MKETGCLPKAGGLEDQDEDVIDAFIKILSEEDKVLEQERNNSKHKF